jgi:nicotinamide-nucleotide amidase
VAATICARDFEIQVDLLADAGGLARAAELAGTLRAGLGRYLVAEDGRPLAELVLQLCRDRGYTLATAESCTGGLVAARLTAVAGASDVFAGSVVAYADEVKADLLEVPVDVLERHGAVSAEAAAAMAAGVRRGLGTDVGVAVTGVAGPGGGSAEKPVGLVYFHVSTPAGEAAGDFSVPADRATVQARATVAALQLVRRVLTQSRHEAA